MPPKFNCRAPVELMFATPFKYIVVFEKLLQKVKIVAYNGVVNSNRKIRMNINFNKKKKDVQ